MQLIMYRSHTILYNYYITNVAITSLTEAFYTLYEITIDVRFVTTAS